MSYGYNKYSSNMSSRGRGFSSRGGGSYRGRGGGGGSEWNGGSTGGNVSGRGGYSSSRGGRFKYSTTSYDSRSKYNSGSERYSSRGGRGEHSNNYKRPRDSYSGRDDHRSSSESTRKRIRSDSYQGGGSGSGSQRYSSYGSSTSAPYDDNKGSSSSAVYEDKRQSERASSYHRSEDRHSASRSYAPPPPPRISEMAPPPTQRYNSSRGRISHQSSNYRGRISTRGTGGRGGAFHRVSSRSDVLLARKRTLHSLDYRRKLIGSRSRDYIQRVRVTTKLRRSSGTTRLPGSKKESGSGTSVKDKDREMAKAINAEFSDDDEDDNKSNWDDEEKPHERDEDEDIEEEEEKKKKEDKRKKEKQDRERQHTEDEEEKDDDIKEEDDDRKREEDEDDDGDEERDDNEKAERDRNADSEELPSRRDGRKFIKLKCPHCAHHSVTFKEYSLHLFSGRHSAAMKRIAARHKVTLTRMRVVQRQEQRRIESRDAVRGTLPSRTMFCTICKLNYRSLKAAHQLSESHRQMKRFLTPFCRVCRIQFRSPMFFETHMCSLEHIKRKSILRERMNANGSGEAEADSSAPEEDDKEVNLDNFMTLDSVGDVDEDEESSDKKKEKTEGESSSEAEKKSKGKQMIKVGAEYIKRVEVQYCELCKVYLPRSENTERAVALHCSTRSHLKRYVRDNDDKALRRQAERIHLQSSSATNANSNSSTVTNSTLDNAKASPINSEPQVSATLASNVADNNSICGTEYVKIEEEKSNSIESEKNVKDSKNNQGDEDDDDYRAHGSDKTIWDDVDKDLSDILRESEAGAKSSDDEDSRYDRFRNSDKKLAGKEKENDKNEILEDKGGNNKIKDVKN